MKSTILMVVLVLSWAVPSGEAWACKWCYRRCYGYRQSYRPVRYTYTVQTPVVEDQDDFEPVPPPPPPEPEPVDDEGKAAPNAPEIGGDKQAGRLLVSRAVAPWYFKRRVTLPSLRSDGNWQGLRSCAPVACAVAMCAYGESLDKHLPVLQAMDPEEDGTPLERITAFLELTFSVTTERNVSVGQLVEQVNSGMPALLIVRTDNSDEGSTHAVWLSGYTMGKNDELLSWGVVDNGVVNGAQVPHFAVMGMLNYSAQDNWAVFIQPKEGEDSTGKSFSKVVELDDLSLPGELRSKLNCVSVAARLFRGSGIDIDQNAMDRLSEDIDPDGDGIATDDYVAWLDRFVDVEEHRGTTTEVVADRLDGGLPVVVAVRLDGKAQWGLLTGYSANEKHEPTSWTLVNASEHEVTNEEFEAAWQCESLTNCALFITPNDDKEKPTFPPPPLLISTLVPEEEERPRDMASETNGAGREVGPPRVVVVEAVDTPELRGEQAAGSMFAGGLLFVLAFTACVGEIGYRVARVN